MFIMVWNHQLVFHKCFDKDFSENKLKIFKEMFFFSFMGMGFVLLKVPKRKGLKIVSTCYLRIGPRYRALPIVVVMDHN